VNCREKRILKTSLIVRYDGNDVRKYGVLCPNNKIVWCKNLMDSVELRNKENKKACAEPDNQRRKSKKKSGSTRNRDVGKMATPGASGAPAERH